MSVKQYIRKASLIIGQDAGNAVDLSDLRFSFAIRRGDLQTPNTADIRVYNVAPQTAQAIQKEFTRIVLQAGYEGNYGVIFDGQIKQVRRGRESQTDTYLDITAADGDSAYNFAVCAISLAAGSTPKDHVQSILKNMSEFGISKGYIVYEDLQGNPLPRGKVLYGMSRDEMRKIARNTQTSWSIQDGKLNLIPETAYIPGEIPVINAATGLIGLPEQTQNGISLKTLLNPNIKIGQAIKLDNSSIQLYRFSLGLKDTAIQDFQQGIMKVNDDGYYYVMVADHQGDTRSNSYYSNLICLAIDATTVSKDHLSRTAVRGDIGTIKRYG